VIVISLLIAAILIFVYIFTQSNPFNSIDTQEEAIIQAQEYDKTSTGNCLTVLTPATHTDTGAKYTFSSSCLAPGWESDL